MAIIFEKGQVIENTTYWGDKITIEIIDVKADYDDDVVYVSYLANSIDDKNTYKVYNDCLSIVEKFASDVFNDESKNYDKVMVCHSIIHEGCFFKPYNTDRNHVEKPDKALIKKNVAKTLNALLITTHAFIDTTTSKFISNCTTNSNTSTRNVVVKARNVVKGITNNYTNKFLTSSINHKVISSDNMSNSS